MLKKVLRWVLKLLFRVEVHGVENMQRTGKRTLIVANHTSFLDAVLMAVFLPGDFSFAIHTHIVDRWYMKPFRRLVKLFAMDPTNPFSLKSLINYMKEDHSVVIFPEGRITVTGSLMKIYHGPGLVADKVDADVLPVRIDGAQYSFFSRLRKRVRIRWFPKITLTVLAPRKIKAPKEVRGRARRKYAGEILTDIMNEMMFATSNYHRTLFEAVLDAQRIHGRKHIIAEDIQRSPVSYRQLILRSYILADAIRKQSPGNSNIGILLPNTVSTLITMFALQINNQVPAMLNFSTGTRGMLSACRTAEIKTVYTSRRFVSYARLENVIEKLAEQVEVIYLEDVVEKLTVWHKLRGLVANLFPRVTYHRRCRKISHNDPALVLFTSGSEGEPKGVVLSHSNILANCAQTSSRIDFSARDIVLNALPMFHSFGLTGGTLLPVISGVRVFFYPTPLHYRIIPEIAYDINATIMFGTNTFLAGYARFAHPYDFYSMRYVFAGAEKLQESTRKIWSERFGVRIFEGYGATETSPVLSMNTAMDHQPGTVGRLVPGMQYKLIPVEGVQQGGRLWVKGPNVMLGYLLHNRPGVIQPPYTEAGEGWYDTGDIVMLDERSFITIQGRAKRFAKVGGEMVSLSLVEELAGKTWPGDEHAVVTIPDETKGEQLVLVTTHVDPQRCELLAFAREQGIGELNVPRKLLYMKRVPVLGTGKTDYKQLKQLVDQELGL